MTLEFIAVDNFDNCILNLKHLNIFILENCILPFLPVDVGNLSVTYFSLMLSKLM